MSDDRTRILDTLLDRYGRTFADELGIDIERGTPAPLYQLLVAADLFSARIGTQLAVSAAAGIIDRWSTPEKLADSTWDERVSVLNDAGYTRYQEQSSTNLGELAELLVDRYGGDLRQLRDEADRDPDEMRRRLKEFQGIGDVGVDIFFREGQVVWDELFPFADDRALDTARELGLGDSIEDLRELASDDELPELLAALVRAGNDADLEALRTGEVDEERVIELRDESKADLYERAQDLDVSGRSKMDKEELAEAVSRRER